jgi:hypothetical protein
MNKLSYILLPIFLMCSAGAALATDDMDKGTMGQGAMMQQDKMGNGAMMKQDKMMKKETHKKTMRHTRKKMHTNKKMKQDKMGNGAMMQQDKMNNGSMQPMK